MLEVHWPLEISTRRSILLSHANLGAKSIKSHVKCTRKLSRNCKGTFCFQCGILTSLGRPQNSTNGEDVPIAKPTELSKLLTMLFQGRGYNRILQLWILKISRMCVESKRKRSANLNDLARRQHVWNQGIQSWSDADPLNSSFIWLPQVLF